MKKPRLIRSSFHVLNCRWVFIYEKGYQIEDTAISSVFTKMKGLAYTEQNGEERLWDVADYVFPDQVSGATSSAKV